MKEFFLKLWKNFLGSFSGYKVFLHVAAIGSTYVLVTSGFDWTYFTKVQTEGFRALLFPAVIIGGLLPIFLPIFLFAVGKTTSRPRLVLGAFVAVQGAILGSFVSSLYKAFTGRIQPEMFNTSLDISRQFQFGFLKHGVFWGWPSSHTTIAFAVSVALAYVFGKNKKLAIWAMIYAFYIGVGVTVGIHWFSEFIAGALIGTAIGLTVGKSYKS